MRQSAQKCVWRDEKKNDEHRDTPAHLQGRKRSNNNLKRQFSERCEEKTGHPVHCCIES